MKFEPRFKLLILLNVLVSMCGFGLVNQTPGLIIPALVLAIAGWWTTEVRSHRGSWAGLPRWLTSIILVLMLLVAIVRAWIAKDLVAGFTEFLAAVIILKLWERRATRDYGQLITLSLFMTVGSTLSDSGMITGAIWAIQLPLLVAAVMMFQIYSAGDRAKSLAGAAAQREAPPPTAGAGQLQRPAFARLCASVLLFAMAISAIVFVLIPRGSGLEDWSMLQVRQGRVTGFTEEVDLGAGSLISDSYTGVFEVQFSSSRGNLGGNGATFYLRGAVLEAYAAGRWAELPGRAAASFTAVPERWINLHRASSDAPEPSNEVIEQSFTVLAGAREPIPFFAIYRPIGLMLDATAQAQQVRFDRNNGWLQRDPTSRRVTAYQVRSRTPEPDPSQVERRPCPTYPNDRVRQLAADILRSANIDPDPASRPLQDDQRAVQAFESHLRSPAFSYVRDSEIKPPLGVDPIYWFLNTRREGHCEYFASALAGLCRSVGINARVVAGYLANEFDPDRGVYVVRESDAHAWAEVDTGPAGWEVFDATPASASRQVRRETLFDRVRRVSAGANEWWASNVVTFSQAQQDKLLSRFGASSLTDSAVRLYRRSVQNTRQFFAKLRSPAFAASIAGACTLAGGLAWVLIRAWKRRTPRVKTEFGWAMRGPERSVYTRTLKLLASRGHPKPSWSPPLVHLRNVATRDPDLAGRANSIMQLLYESRFGGNRQRLEEAKRLLSDLRALN